MTVHSHKEQIIRCHRVTRKLKVSDKLLEKTQLIVCCEDAMYTGLDHIKESQTELIAEYIHKCNKKNSKCIGVGHITIMEAECNWAGAKTWVQWWTRNKHLQMLTKPFSVMNPKDWDRAPRNTNGVE